jgi:transmembrane sensor
MERMSRLREQISAEAADWFARLSGGDVSPATREEFTNWTLRSPLHIEEFLAISRAWGDVGFATSEAYSKDDLIRAAREEPEADNVVPFAAASREPLSAIEHGAASRVENQPEGRYAWRAAIAAMVLVVAGVISFGAVQWLGAPTYRTAIGEQRTITLKDGSIVHLNTNSEISFAYADDERRIHLKRGEARFEVAKNPERPFVVHTSRATVRALGTIFNVQVAPTNTAVAVLEGRVEVVSRDAPPRIDARSAEDAPEAAAPSLQRIQLAAGEQAAITPQGEILANAGPPLDRVKAWTERRLVFREDRLSDVVAEFNRYHEEQIRIADASLAEHRISGTFAVQDVASLVQFLERYEHVEVEDTPDGQVLRRRATTEASIF